MYQKQKKKDLNAKIKHGRMFVDDYGWCFCTRECVDECIIGNIRHKALWFTKFYKVRKVNMVVKTKSEFEEALRKIEPEILIQGELRREIGRPECNCTKDKINETAKKLCSAFSGESLKLPLFAMLKDDALKRLVAVEYIVTVFNDDVMVLNYIGTAKAE